ncbi:MAG: hypothetical protein J7J72_00560, partial [Bacteroidales bacterium]|nr:hypothetical protein [Bacteroidales bacterium]
MKDLYIAKTFAGLEGVLAQELRDLQIEEVEVLNRAVSFKGDLKDLYSANYWCRTAIRILKPIAEFPAEDELALYKGIRSIDWSTLMGLDDTFAIDATLSNSKINHSQYAALKTKDAIADQFVFKFKQRPNVETTRPTLRVSIFIQNDICTVSLDTSNISLHKRGYRVSAGSAPLNEVLAAGMILLSGWDKNSHFVDPMCGSGTLLIEAALIAMDIPPAIYRDYFGFFNFKDFDADLWKEIKFDALAKQKDIDFKIVGTDLASGMITVAEKNIQSAHLQKDIQIEQLPMQEFTPPEAPGFMICNPPYGERIQTRDIVELYRSMGDTMKRKYGGYTVWIISSDIIALKQIGLYPSQKLELYNGPLECRYEKFEIYVGSKKEKYQNYQGEENKSGEPMTKGPAYRRKDDWDKEGKNTKFKGKTKSEWELESRSKHRTREPRKEFDKTDDRKSNRSDSERLSYPSKRREPKREFHKSDDRRDRKTDSERSGKRSSYPSKSREPRREFHKSDDRRDRKPDSERSGERSSYPSKSREPRREFHKSDDRRDRKTDSERSGERS